MSPLSLSQQARAQEDAARHARRLGLNYLASRCEALAHRMREDEAKALAQASVRAEAS